MLGLRRIARLLAVSAGAAALVLLLGVIVNGTRSALSARNDAGSQPAYQASANKLFLQGRRIFRYDTFGDRAFWGGALQLHKAIEGAKFGGVGGGVSPKTALALGLKADKVDLNSPATTLALLKLNAVVGLKVFFNKGGSLREIRLTCAAPHSTA